MPVEVRASVPEQFRSRFRGGREFPNGEWVTLTDEEWKGALGEAIRGDAAFEHRKAKAKAAEAPSPLTDPSSPPAPNPEAVNNTPHDPDPRKSQEALPK